MSEVSLFDPTSQSIEPITLTAAAAFRVKNTIAKQGSGKGLRLVIKKTGCSGYSYQVEIFNEQQADDYIFPAQDDLCVVVSKAFLDLVKGTRIDYIQAGLGSGFRFYNPNQKGECGCGESFTV